MYVEAEPAGRRGASGMTSERPARGSSRGPSRRREKTPATSQPFGARVQPSWPCGAGSRLRTRAQLQRWRAPPSRAPPSRAAEPRSSPPRVATPIVLHRHTCPPQTGPHRALELPMRTISAGSRTPLPPSRPAQWQCYDLEPNYSPLTAPNPLS